MMHLLNSPVAKARLILLLVGLALPSVVVGAEFAGLLDMDWGFEITFAVCLAVILLAFRVLDRILDKGRDGAACKEQLRR
ncbi:hypothetical protein JKG68_02675 [Microvirga aerilata]|uniref:Uncharacterized protein n=1 Tax=Microvirga aerilata TaxID=670292 RepID=A0A936ZDL2_9HYPH|nr:hypothetical protein [Microvirga aerilata]MBL0402864.1 hypothetical protein [Microvirga aerilata]